MRFNQSSSDTKKSRFNRAASSWRLELQGHGNEDERRKDLDRRWQQYSETTTHMSRSATLTNVNDDERKKRVGNFWYNKGPTPMQASVALNQESTTMNDMLMKLKEHPLAVGSDNKSKWMYLDGKVNTQSKPEDHESTYNVMLTTILGFNLVVGYSRYKDPKFHTHA